MTNVSQQEQDLLAAGDRLGQCMANASSGDKAILRDLHEAIDKFANQKHSEGVLIDKAAMFACHIVTNPEIEDDDLVRAAGEYIDKDYLLCKSLRDQKS